MALQAEVGDVVTGRDESGRTRIGRVAAAFTAADGTPAPRIIVATPEGDWFVEPERLSVVRPNFVQETWAAMRYPGHNPWQPDPREN